LIFHIKGKRYGKVFENWMLRKIYGSMAEQVAGAGRNYMMGLLCSDQKREVGNRGENRNACRVLVRHKCDDNSTMNGRAWTGWVIQDNRDKWQAVVNAAMNLKYTIGLLGTIWLVTTAACFSCMWPPPGDSTELTGGIATVVQSCAVVAQGPLTDVTCSVLSVSSLAGRNRLVLHFLYSTVTHT
jgi:hypothetical protein